MNVGMQRFCYKMVCRTMFVKDDASAISGEMAEASQIPSDKKPDPFNNRLTVVFFLQLYIRETVFKVLCIEPAVYF
jgi:hypothetical protein